MEYRINSTKKDTTVLEDGHAYEALKQALYYYNECTYNANCGYSDNYELCCIGTSYYDYDTYCDYTCYAG